MASAANVELQDYSDKSFVVRGEGTRDLRESLKAFGGKWNSRLTDKATGEKFGAWLFWTEKRPDIEKWIGGGCEAVEPRSGNVSISRVTSGILNPVDGSLERKVDELTRMVALLCDHFELEPKTVSSDDDEPAPPRRLLKR
jgi:hypothetical protein